MRYRIIDARKTLQQSIYPEAIARRPWTVQEIRGGHWETIPGAWFATREEALACTHKLKELNR